MGYPPPPWVLQGEAILAVGAVDAGAARAALPAGLSVVPVWPGKTLGGVLLGAYGPGSTLEYHELIVFGALVRRGLRVGTWVSAIYVDSEASMAGGRAIWGLPKEMADFDWQGGAETHVAVRRGGRLLCEVVARSRRTMLPVPVLAPAFGLRGGGLIWFAGRGIARAGPARARWGAPPGSPVADVLRSRQPFTVRCGRLQIRVAAPRAAG